MSKQNILDIFRQKTLTRRTHIQLNNPKRTDYYFAFWKKHPEVSWALLANLVSRNTGWFMSDIIRASSLAPYGMKIPGFPPAHYQAFFAFLETGNFLIFRDVFPQLEAYAWAKRYPQQSEEFFNLLGEEPEFDVDPFMVQHWKEFFSKAQLNNWFPNWWQEPDVQRQAFAQIANEQNQLHDRLINDEHHRYLGFFMSSVVSQIFLALTSLGMAKLCFPVAKSSTDTKANYLLVYTLNDFKPYENRVNVGRDLYVGLFGEEKRRERVIAWANAHRYFRGTRFEYNPTDFSVNPHNFSSTRKYSPPLVRWQGQPPAWPTDATKMIFYSHLHNSPVPLPITVKERGSIVEELLNPLKIPQRLFEKMPLSDLAEVTIGSLSGWQINILLQKIVSKLNRKKEEVAST